MRHSRTTSAREPWSGSRRPSCGLRVPPCGVQGIAGTGCGGVRPWGRGRSSVVLWLAYAWSWTALALSLTLAAAGVAAGPEGQADWADTMAAAREGAAGNAADLAAGAMARFPRQTDWLLQDCGGDLAAWQAWPADGDPVSAPWLARVLAALPAAEAGAVREESLRLRQSGASGHSPDWLRLYERACQARRRLRLAALAAAGDPFIFVRRFPVSPSFFAYTEGQSDAQHERHFRPGSELCRLRVDEAGEAQVETLLASPDGVIRDPDVSYDGGRILFAWKQGETTDDYHLYELTAATGAVRQLTFGLGAADYEPAYLPGGDIVFASTRCVQTVDCWWTEVSNLYLCNGDGRYLRRVGFDQVHAVCPHVLDDGTVVYTRWDYNDRGQIWPQGLFRMAPDGTGQAELYGNNSYFPTTIVHARGIPGTQRLLAVACGHHTWQAGKLIEVDPTRGRQENEGVEMLAPRRPAEAVRIDAYGQEGDLFRHPFPLSGRDCLVGFVPAALNRGRNSVFSLYWIGEAGDRELLVQGTDRSCNHPVRLAPRPEPPVRASTVDYRRDTGLFYVQDVYHGPGLAGVPRGTIERLRVVALEYRAAGVQSNGNSGPGGAALVSTPIAINNGSWDVKRVLGSVRVQPDGSAFFQVPARTPVYLQALDANGEAVQTMRSWATLQPGETQSCSGCHEAKNTAPPSQATRTLALERGPEALEPFWGPTRGFSYIREVQPIWDRHCLRCHGPSPEDSSRPVPSASFSFPAGSHSAFTDGILPRNSDDHGIPRHTWWAHKGTAEWAQLSFAAPRTMAVCQVYWFDDRPRNGGCRVPASWRLLYQDGESWREVAAPSGYGVAADTFNTVRFAPVTTTALRLEVTLMAGFSSGILEWLCGKDDAELEQARKPRLDLSGTQKPGPGGRAWSTSYLSLTHSGTPTPLVNWLNVQSIPSLLPPYSAGAARSRLPALLREGHHEVRLSREELERISCWIDLLVPYCGDYTEANAWTEAEQLKYDHFRRKRQRLAQVEARHIEALVRDRTGERFRFDDGYTNVALNPFAAAERRDELPFAETNSVCRDEPCFAAANVIDGRVENRGHGPQFPSWGPDRREDLWLRLDFGSPARIDRIDLWVRADVPHDAYWQSALLEFSDGSMLPVTLEETPDRQSFTFPERVAEWVRLTRLVSADPSRWCALSEVEVWGWRLPTPAAASDGRSVR